MNLFEQLGLTDAIVEAVSSLGFSEPTPIQQEAIPVLLQDDTDFIGLAQTGTGKTAAFGLPLLHLIDPTKNNTQALVLAPTRELGLQITDDLKKFSKFIPGLQVVAVYGGAPITTQIKQLKKGAQVVVATPGRLIDLLSRKAVKLNTVQYVVLDEADEMLNMGFKEDIDNILSTTPLEKQTWLFSATMPKEVERISKSYMTDPYELTVGKQNASNKNIDHQYCMVNHSDKYAALKRMVDFNPDMFGVVFCRTRMDTQQVAEQLIRDGYNADALHGDLTQVQRDKVMRRFKNRSLKMLIATDVAARGIDVDNVTHVIHLNLPDEIEFYTHRSGRTARAGRKGISLALISRKELQRIGQLEKRLKTTFSKIMVPTKEQVCEKQLLSFIHSVHNVEVKEDEIEQFLPSIYAELEQFSKEEIIKRVASFEFNRFLEYYQNAPDLNLSDKGRGEGKSSRYTTGDRLFINVGKMDGLNNGSLINLICQTSNISGSHIGKIELKGAYSFFELDKSQTAAVLSGFEGAEYQNRAVRVEITEERKSSGGNRKKRGDKGGHHKERKFRKSSRSRRR